MRLLTNPGSRRLFISVALAATVFAMQPATRPENGGGAAAAIDDGPPSPPEFKCHCASGQITIDGQADEPAWESADVIEGFTAHWLDRAARSATRARLLWDRDNLYFFAEMDDADL